MFLPLDKAAVQVLIDLLIEVKLVFPWCNKVLGFLIIVYWLLMDSSILGDQLKKKKKPES